MLTPVDPEGDTRQQVETVRHPSIDRLGCGLTQARGPDFSQLTSSHAEDGRGERSSEFIRSMTIEAATSCDAPPLIMHDRVSCGSCQSSIARTQAIASLSLSSCALRRCHRATTRSAPRAHTSAHSAAYTSEVNHRRCVHGHTVKLPPHFEIVLSVVVRLEFSSADPKLDESSA
jgi:hypothetical protein